MEHARLSASGSATWINCSASTVAQEVFRAENPDFTGSSEYADEGTAAHEVAAYCLKSGADAADYPEPVYTVNGVEYEVDLEMREAIQEYLDTVRAIKGRLYVEVKLDLNRWIPGGFGTADAVVITANGDVYVFDLKYGKGVQVFAFENTQQIIYAMGVMDEFEFIYKLGTFTMTIVQPRMGHIDEYEQTYEEINAWGARIATAAEIAAGDDTTFTPGVKQCQWCDAKPECDALQAHVENEAMIGFEMLEEIKEGHFQTEERLRDILQEIPLMKKWISSLEGFCEAQMLAGLEIPEFKLVHGRSSREWTDPIVAEKKLRNVKKLLAADCFNKKLKTPPQIEKLLGKTHTIMKTQVTYNEGKLTIAPESDKRPAVNVTAGFENVDENEDSKNV